MIWDIFTTSPKSFLGIDIGTFSVKIVELSRHGNRRKLDNYAEIQAGALYEKAFRSFEKSTLSVSNADVVRAIKAALQEARIKSNQAVFSIPDFSTFFTTFTLPPMTEEEISQAVQYEARQHIPLPLSEVTLDWQIVERNQKGPKAAPYKILLVAVPNEVVRQYQDIALNANLELVAMEAEVFGMARILSASEKEKGPVALMDLGARSTTISIVDMGSLKISHSFDTSGNDFTDVIAKALRTTHEQAEAMKREQGLNVDQDSARAALLPILDLIMTEAKKIFQSFSQAQNKEISKIILSGGSALMPGFPEYVSKNLAKTTEVIDPFATIYYPPILEETLKQIGPSYAIAVGAALRGLE